MAEATAEGLQPTRVSPRFSLSCQRSADDKGVSLAGATPVKDEEPLAATASAAQEEEAKPNGRVSSLWTGVPSADTDRKSVV